MKFFMVININNYQYVYAIINLHIVTESISHLFGAYFILLDSLLSIESHAFSRYYVVLSRYTYITSTFAEEFFFSQAEHFPVHHSTISHTEIVATKAGKSTREIMPGGRQKTRHSTNVKRIHVNKN